MKPYKTIRTLAGLLILAVFSTALFAEDKPADPSTPPELQKAIDQAAKLPSSQATELAKTGNEALRFMLDRAKSYTGKIEDGVGKAVDITIKEAPETVRQFLVWRAWKHGVSAAISMACILMFWAAYTYLWFASRKWDDGNKLPARGLLFCVLMFVTMMIGDIGCVKSNALSLVQIKFAPRIYLIEELTKLIK